TLQPHRHRHTHPPSEERHTHILREKRDTHTHSPLERRDRHTHTLGEKRDTHTRTHTLTHTHTPTVCLYCVSPAVVETVCFLWRVLHKHEADRKSTRLNS